MKQTSLRLRHRSAEMEMLDISEHRADRSIVVIIRFGIDLAKSSFAVCGVGENEHIALRKVLNRNTLLHFFANQPSAVVAMEADSGAHHWARELCAIGRDAALLTPVSFRLIANNRRAGKSEANNGVAGDVLGILNRGDSYLRTLLNHGARSQLNYTPSM